MTELLQPKHLTQAVKGLHFRNSLEIHKLLKDNEDFCISFGPEDGLQKVNVEKMVGMLPLHLIAVLMTFDKDDKLKYVLCGIRLLNTFCDLTSRHPKLEQVMLDDVKLTAQMLDLVILIIISLGGNRKERCNSATESLIDATLVASSLYLMHGFISPNYQDLVLVLLAHPRVDVFIDCVFGAVHNSVRSLKAKLLYRRTDLPTKLGGSSVEVVNMHCQQAEAALQFLQSLCQHKQFRDRVAKNKELCGKGGALMLAQSILSLAVTPELVGAAVAIASISRMKAKVLSILQHLFEAESVSFLDVVVKAGNLHLAKAIAAEVLNLLRFGLSKASKCSAAPDYPMGFVLLNAMRLADVLTDDSNFRSFFNEHFSTVVSAIFCLSHGDFLSMLCSSEISSREDDANVDYDLYTSVGGVLSVFSSVASATPQFKLSLQNNLTMTSYAHQRTALLIKIIANLHCFVPNLCEEEDRNRFVRNFVSGVHKDPSSILVNMLPSTSYTPVEQRGTGVLKNLCSLLHHAESLIPNFVNEEDFMLFRVFCDQSENSIIAQFEDCQVEEQQTEEEPVNLNNEEASENFDVRVEGVTEKSDADASNLETSGSDSSSNRGKSVIDQVEEGELVQNMSKLFKGSGSSRGVKEDEKAETFLVFEKQRKRRKRSIMNDDQMGMIEKALADEPDMQRNSASIQLWADKLSQNGSEVITSSQLKNWLNNRKAKLARANKQTGPVRDNNSSGELPESPGDENTPFKDQTESRIEERSSSILPSIGQSVILMNEEGENIARAIVLKTEGEWCGWYLDTNGMCVVDIMELSGPHDFANNTTASPFGSNNKGKRTFEETAIPYGSDRVGRTFAETVRVFGHMIVAWDLNKLQY